MTQSVSNHLVSNQSGATPLPTAIRMGQSRMRKSILIINRAQFGYHTDTYQYCKHLRELYDLTYVGWDHGRPKLDVDGVRVVYIPPSGPKYVRFVRFISTALAYARGSDDLCFIQYFPGCSLIKLVHPGKRTILDIRTGHVGPNAIGRAAADTLLKLEARQFPNVTVISQSLGDSLSLSEGRMHVLPLGAEIISAGDKTFDALKLLYVGTLHGRRIHETVLGLHRFLQDRGDGIQCSYRIVGSGWGTEEHSLRELVAKLGLESIVEVLGQIPHDQLFPHFDWANVGVSYIPMTKYYDVQPPTKTFEYLLSGMAVIATGTLENKKVIDSRNGVLINDSVESFSEGLEVFASTRHTFDSRVIRDSGRAYCWPDIIRHTLVPYLESL